MAGYCCTNFYVGMRRFVRFGLLSVCAILIATSTAVPVCGQDATPEGMVRLTFQGDVKLDVLVDYIADRLNLRFQYTTNLANRTVTIRSPGLVPVETLPILLGSVLKSENLVVIKAGKDGWYRIVDSGEMKTLAPIGDAAEVLKESGAASPVTQVFVLNNADAASLTTVLTPLLTKTFSNMFKVPDTNALVVTDYASNVSKVAELIRLIDQPRGESVVEFYEVRHQQAVTLVEQVRAVLVSPQPNVRQPAIQLFDEPLSNRIVIAGERSQVVEARQLLEQLDISIGITTAVYRVRNLTAERFDKLVKGYIAPKDAQGAFQSTVDNEGNLMVARATPDVHRQIEALLEDLDKPAESDESPIQFYKLKNARALDVLYSLLALQEASGGSGTGFLGFSSGGAFGGMSPLYSPGFNNTGRIGAANATSAFPDLQRSNDTLRPAMNINQDSLLNEDGIIALPIAPDGTPTRRDGFLPNQQNPLASQVVGGIGAGGVATLPGGARVSADIGTNSLIVYAPANVQPIYRKLIDSLDQRRPQVLIEAKIVAIDTTDDFALGVEVSIGDRIGSKRLFNFSSFGLSEVNPVNGALTIIPALGFNGALVDPDIADVVVQALAQHTRARVLASPKILVNDNATGKLESVASVPFSSVNASQTVSTTSLGGDQQAGTLITATPHINEDNHLQLEFDVEFSTFSGTATDNLPPPRQIDRVGSTVTIPDGKTVIVGGLKRIGNTHAFQGIPWLERIPVIRELTSLTKNSSQTTSFFLFIRPVVLRDSQFSDLEFLSDRDARRACVPGNFPVSHPELVQ